MKKIQVIGLPGSGKTTGINIYIDKNKDMSVLDLATFKAPGRERLFTEAIKKQDSDLIAESACGVDLSGTYVVKLKITESKLIDQLLQRGDKFDLCYTSYLVSQMLPANYTVSNSEQLAEVLQTLFKRY